MKIIAVAGARPNFLKIAPLMKAFGSRAALDASLVHTGQHYDRNMSELFFGELGIPEPDVNLEIGSGSHAVQTAAVMTAFEPVVMDRKPDVVLVVGDINSTIACGLVAVKLGVTLVHVEAGLRSFDRTMPEEINRLLTDSISDVLFCTEKSGVENLAHEGVDPDKVHLVGNVMIDSVMDHREKAEKSTILEDMKLTKGNYAAVTLHRPSNVDDPKVFSGILDALEEVQRDMPAVFPVHPRTRISLEGTDLASRVAGMPGLHMIDPVGYLDFLKLMSSARVVLTDSGGIQEETTILGVPCLTLRENTERPITVEMGTNQLVGCDPTRIIEAYRKVMSTKDVEYHPPPLWDGGAAERIADVEPAIFNPVEDTIYSRLEGYFAEAFITAPTFELVAADPDRHVVEPDVGLVITADESVESNLEGNLVVAISAEVTSKSRKGEKKTRKISLGVLPAIPYRTQ